MVKDHGNPDTNRTLNVNGATGRTPCISRKASLCARHDARAALDLRPERLRQVHNRRGQEEAVDYRGAHLRQLLRHARLHAVHELEATALDVDGRHRIQQPNLVYTRPEIPFTSI